MTLTWWCRDFQFAMATSTLVRLLQWRLASWAVLRTSLSLTWKIKKCNYGLAFIQVTELVFTWKKTIVVLCSAGDSIFVRIYTTVFTAMCLPVLLFKTVLILQQSLEGQATHRESVFSISFHGLSKIDDFKWLQHRLFILKKILANFFQVCHSESVFFSFKLFLSHNYPSRK